MSKVKDLSIIIVNWNTGDLLFECIHSIKETVKDHDYEIFVVDNASTDNSLESVESKHSDLILLKNQENLGFAKGNNLAIPLCQGRFILLLNPDTVLIKDAVDRMCEYLDAHPSTGVIGPRLLNEDGSQQPSTAGSFPTLSIIINEAFGLIKLFPKFSSTRGLYIRSEGKKSLEVDWVSGACLMIRAEIILKVGMLNEGFHLYYEDQEWCYRIKKSGYKIIFYPQAKVLHYGNQSIRRLTLDDFKKNQITHRQYLQNFNNPIKAFLASHIYFWGLVMKWLIALTRHMLTNDEKSQHRYKVLTKILRQKML